MSAKRPSLSVVAATAAVLLVSVAACGGAASSATPGSPAGGGPDGSSGGSAVLISVSAYKPDTITIASGTTVTWTNNDPVVHTVTADDASWDSGSMSRGQTFSRKFDAAGTYTYHCTPHPWMKGTVIVAP